MTQAVQHSYQPVIAADWLAEQIAQQRELLLVVDRLAEPDPIKALFSANLMQDYVNLYQSTELADMTDVGPWLVRVHIPCSEFIQTLLDTPERGWGWLASAERVDLAVLAQHWRERMLINEQEQRALYRFQDNRVIAHHLHGIEEIQRPLLLGPLSSALCWDGQCWQCFDNPRPDQCPAPFETPWLAIAEPETVQHYISRHNLELWLWQNHSKATAELAETRLLTDWLDQQLDKARRWNWLAEQQLHFLLLHQLDPALAEHSVWAPAEHETAEAHFARVSTVLSSPNARKPF
jgi:hypothetical protein